MSKSGGEFDQELEALLSERVEDAKSREATAFDQLAGSNADRLVLFGAGNLGRRTLASLSNVGVKPLCFIDNDPARWGEVLNGISILSPEEGAKLYGVAATFVVTIWRGEGIERMQDRVEQLRLLGCKSVVPFLPLYWKLSGALLPHYLQDLPHHALQQADRIRRAFSLMADEDSRREYLAQVRFRIEGDFDCLPNPVQGEIYFRDELFRLGKDEVFVDCGAFDGDTLSLFLQESRNSFNRIVAFEPDPVNYEKLAARVNLMSPDLRQRISIYPTATGDAHKRVLMDVGIGPASHIGGGSHEVECVTLDSALANVPVTVLKMDIEGSELSTLNGSRRLIHDHSPVLAICVYHRQDDLWNIPLLIHELHGDYSLYLRPHLLEGWDLVCYAIPPERRN